MNLTSVIAIVDAYSKKLLTEWYQRLDDQAQII